MAKISSQINIINQQNRIQYIWNKGCFGWHYLNQNHLSIIREEMAPMTSEQLHFHEKSQQFFYILNGDATFHLEDEIYSITAGDGIHVLPKQTHRIENKSTQKVEFLIISNPHAHGDKILMPQKEK